jgi:hypothetical protein
MAPSLFYHKGWYNANSLTSSLNAPICCSLHQAHFASTVYHSNALGSHKLPQFIGIAEIAIVYLCTTGTIDANTLYFWHIPNAS